MHSLYKFTNLINDKSYIGISKEINKRKRRHILDSKQENPPYPLHRAIKKYGEGVFTFEILIENIASLSNACLLEIENIKKYDSYNSGYNLTLGGEGVLGVKGSKSPVSKITDEVAKQIINDNCSHLEAANKYNTTTSSVQYIRNIIGWDYLDKQDKKYYKLGCKRIDKETALSVISDSCSHAEASRKYNLDKSNIYDIRSGRTWKKLDRTNAPTYINGRVNKVCIRSK